MTNSEKATALLSYLDGLDTTTVINVLHPFIEDDVLATEYDNFVADGLIEESKQRAKRIAFYEESDECYETLTNAYQNFDLDSFVERAKSLYPEIFKYNDVGEIDGEIEQESERYIITYEDAIQPCVRIYEKV